MIRLLTILLLFFYGYGKSQATGPFLSSWVNNSVISNGGYYEAFPMILDAIYNQTEGIFKQSSTHAGAGSLIFVKTTDKLKTWSKNYVTFNSIPVTALNHSIGRKSTTRTTIAYRATDSLIRIGYNDLQTHVFTLTQILDLDTDSFLVYPSPVRMVEMPSGNLRLILYKLNKFGGRTVGEIWESEDGETFAFFSQIYSHNSAVTTPTLGDWRGNEIAIGITHNTGIDSTCKMIALIRVQVASEGGVSPMHFFSSDGGSTWSKSLTADPGSFVDDLGATIVNNSPGLSRHLLYSFLASNSPFDIRLHNGKVYVVNGERRNSYGYSLKYITASPDGAFQNKWNNWIRPFFKKFYNAKQLGSSTDCGYPVIFIANNDLYVSQYDVSTLPAIPAQSAKRIFCEIQKIE